MKKLVASSPNVPDYYLLLTQTQIAMGKFNDAVTSINAALALKKDNPEYLNLKATIYLSAWKLNEAREILNYLISRNDRNYSTYELMAYSYYIEKNYKYAEYYLRKLNNISYREPEYRYFLSLVLLKQAKYQEAIDTIDRISNITPVSSRYYVIRATAYVMQNMCDEAAKDVSLIRRTVTLYDWDTVSMFKSLYENKCKKNMSIQPPAGVVYNPQDDSYTVQKVSYNNDAYSDDSELSYSAPVYSAPAYNQVDDQQNSYSKKYLPQSTSNTIAKNKTNNKNSTFFEKVYYDLKQTPPNYILDSFYAPTSIIPKVPALSSNNTQLPKKLPNE